MIQQTTQAWTSNQHFTFKTAELTTCCPSFPSRYTFRYNPTASISINGHYIWSFSRRFYPKQLSNEDNVYPKINKTIINIFLHQSGLHALDTLTNRGPQCYFPGKKKSGELKLVWGERLAMIQRMESGLVNETREEIFYFASALIWTCTETHHSVALLLSRTPLAQHKLFTLQPSGERFRCLQAKTRRLKKAHLHTDKSWCVYSLYSHTHTVY